MSAGTGSGSSTPRGGMTPPPPPSSSSSAGGGSGGGGGPSPLAVGTRFVKQYYKVLSTTPGQVHRFYQPNLSVLSHGIGSEPGTPPRLFEHRAAATAADAGGGDDPRGDDVAVLRFYRHPDVASDVGCPIRFEFEHGAIDAQVSVNGGVLLAVTGHVLYLTGGGGNNNHVNADDDEEDEEDSAFVRKAFVHTFFLGNMTKGTKRSYYVHNDILRFLDDERGEDRTVVTDNKDSRRKSTFT